MTDTPPCLKRMVEEAKAHPYESFASAAVALAFHNDENCPLCTGAPPEAEGKRK